MNTTTKVFCYFILLGSPCDGNFDLEQNLYQRKEISVPTIYGQTRRPNNILKETHVLGWGGW